MLFAIKIRFGYVLYGSKPDQSERKCLYREAQNLRGQMAEGGSALRALPPSIRPRSDGLRPLGDRDDDGSRPEAEPSGFAALKPRCEIEGEHG